MIFLFAKYLPQTVLILKTRTTHSGPKGEVLVYHVITSIDYNLSRFKCRVCYNLPIVALIGQS
jgi:hypothetical protein